jgi:mannose-6-phosphate isomerase-like protein (cupin superfamily)
MKMTKAEAARWAYGDLEGWSYGSKDTSPTATASVVHVNGRHGRGKTTVSDRLFYILEGTGEFEVGDRRFPVEATDIVVVPKDTPFDYNGTLRLLVVHVPAYDHDHEVALT